MVSAVQITHIFNGDNSASDFVDAALLDTQFANLANTLNQEIATRQISISDQGRINNSIVRYTSLHPEVIAALQGIIPGQDVQAVAQTNIAALTGTPIIDGYQTVIGDRVLLVGQTAQVQNGIYVVAAGAWAIAYDSVVAFVQYQCWAVLNGASGAGTVWMVYTLGTTGSVASTFIPILGFASLLPITRGGTGANNAPQALINLGVPALINGLLSQVATVTALKLVAAPVAGALYTTQGYYAVADGGAAFYFWNASDARADNGGTILQLTAGGVGRWNLIYTSFLSIRWFGAKGDLVHDDTTAINSCLTVAGSLGSALGGVSVYIPPGNFLVSNTLTMAIPLKLYGDGPGSIIYAATAMGAGLDVITLSPTQNQYGFILEDFEIQPQSGTPARHAISINITQWAVYNCRFKGLITGTFGGRGIVTLPNASPLLNGFFTSIIEKCIIYNGIYLDKAGDSIRIRDNTLTGSNVAVYVDLVFASTSNQAHGLEITGNNITNNGGALLCQSAWSGRFARNNVEVPTPVGLTNNCVININGTNGTNQTWNFVIAENNISSGVGIDLIRVNFAYGTVITKNFLAEPGGGAFNVRVTANAFATQILFNQSSGIDSLATQVTDAGTGTMWLRSGLGYALESNQNMVMVQQNGSYGAVDTSGTTIIPMLKFNAADNTVHIGAQTAPASDGHLILYANGLEYAKITPAGLVQIGGASGGGKLMPSTDALAYQTLCGIMANTGAPNNANGANGDFYFNAAGGALTSIYQKRAGAWVGIV